MLSIRNLQYLTTVGALGAVLALGTVAKAQEFPNDTMTLIVPFSAGGGTDLWARAIVTGGLEVTGHPINVRNMPGASAVLGWNNLLDLPADGHTLMLASPTPMLSLLSQENPPLDLDDIRIVAYVGAFRSVIVTQTDMGWTDWDSFVAYAQENPREVTLGATTSNLVGVATTFESAGVEVTLVPYSSTADVTADFVGGHIDAIAGPAADISTFAPEYGQVILNASDLPLSDDFSELFGNPPLATEIELAGVSLPRWIGVHPDTPDAVVEELSSIVGQLLEHTAASAMLAAIDAEVIYTPHAEAQAAYDALVGDMRNAVELLQ